MDRDILDKPFVLIVDDIEDNALLLEFILGEEDYIIKCATSVREAVEIMGEGLPDIILTDITMPDVDGFEFMTMLKNNNRTRDIPIVVISGLDSNDDKQKAFELGAISFLGKPYDRFEIQNNIAVNVKLRRMQQELEEYNRKLNRTIESQYKRIEQEQKHILLALANITEMESGYSDNRLEKIAYNSRILAQSLSFVKTYEDYISQDYLDTIEVAALLHDIGRIAMDKEDTKNECEHATRGANILRSVYKEISDNRFLNMAIGIAQYHHHDFKSDDEEAVQGIKIPLSARIVRIVVDFDKFKREYDNDINKTLEYMKEHSGEWYDPEIIDIFARIINQMH